MDGPIFPLTFYCRNAQLCLTKATESQKSGFGAEELQHLRTFTTLVSETIPAHPNYRNRQEDKQVLELHAYLPEAGKRIRELEATGVESSRTRRKLTSHGRHGSRHSKPPLSSLAVASRSLSVTQAGEGRDLLLDEGRSANVVLLGTSEEEEDGSCSEIGDEKSRCPRGGYADESSASDSVKYWHHGGKDRHEHAFRGTGLREWKGEFVGKSERVCCGSDEGESLSGSSTGRILQSKRRQNSRRRVEKRPTSAPRTMQGAMVDCKPNDRFVEDSDDVDANNRESRGEHEKTAVVAPRLQRGLKEDCERFRRDMQLLIEKANDSSSREVEADGLSKKLQGRMADDMDVAAVDSNRLEHTRVNLPRDNSDKRRVAAVRASTLHSRRIIRLRGGHPSVNHGADPSEMHEKQPGGGHSLSCKSPCATADSGSSSGSSPTSLPLSHYIQKLKDFSPDSQLGSANVELLTPVNKAAGYGSNQQDYHEKFSSEYAGVLHTSNELGHGGSLLSTTLSGGSASAIFLPASTSPSSTQGLPRSSPGSVNNRFGASSSMALYTSLAHPTQPTHPIPLGASTLRPLQLFNLNPELKVFARQDEERPAPVVTTLDDQLSHPHFQNDTENNMSLEAKDEKMNSIQLLLGELKGSVQGMKIRLDVDGQGWRGRLEGLEKELENLKEEADDEIIAAKHSLRNELKVKLGDLMAEVERTRRQERDEVEMMVEERIEKQLEAQKDTRSSVDTKDEIRLLWAEVDALVKSRQEMQGHVEHLTSVAQKAQEHANRERDMLKSENGYLRKQLQSLKNDGVQVRLETEDFRVEREDLRLAVDKLKGEGTDMNLELQSLKKVEKHIKVELEELRIGLIKVQEETQNLERQKGTLHVEGGRERIMIMEKVESLSQRYLGGLEEVRTDVLNVKFNCRDQIQKFENQWNEFRKQLLQNSTFTSKQMLLDELDHFHGEIEEMVEIERGLVRQTLERESEAVQRKVKDLLVGSKGEIVNAVRLDVQKWLQATHEKVFLMTEALKQDLDSLKNELGRTQEGAEDLIHVILEAEIQRDVAAAAATDASMSATKASNVLMDVTASINDEMTNTHQRIKHFQENLAAEKEIVASAMYEARKVGQELQKEKEAALLIVQEARHKHQELQDYLERESSRLLVASLAVKKERDTASQAASEAASSAMKAREVLAEILDTYNLEMTQVRHRSLQLQEFEKEKAGLERERELAAKNNHNAQDRFREEFLLAIDGWKHAMNTEISRAKEVADDLEKQLRRRELNERDQLNFQLSSASFPDQLDPKDYISKTEESITGLAAMVKEIQDYREHLCEEKKRRMILKQQENARKEQHWNGEISQIHQVVRVVEKRVLDACGDYTEMRKRLKKCEGAHIDLIHTVEEVSSSTSELAKTVSVWLPRYEAASRIVNDLSSKVERVEEKLEGFSCDEGLVQRISRIAETKVEGFKELMSSSAAMEDIGQELRDLHERVENSDRVHCQAVGEVASRVAMLERTVSRATGQPSPGLSLKVEYTDTAEARKQGMGSLSQSLEALERKMEFMTEHTGALVGGHEPASDARLQGLESRIEHVASATFTNLRLLDSKVDRVSVGMQSAVEGAALAESKCGALGAELVKVFRMLTASNPSGSSTNRQVSTTDTRRGRSHSPLPQSLNPQLDSRSQSPGNQFTTFTKYNNRAIFSPKRRSRLYISPNRPKAAAGPKRGGLRSMTRNGAEADCMKSSTGSGSGKLTARDHAEGESTYSGASEEGSTPNRQSCYYLRTSLNDTGIGCKLHTQGTQLSVHDRSQAGEHPQPNTHLPPERRQDRSGKITSHQNPGIRLEAGRIQVNVRHRSSEKRENLIAVQS